MNQKFGDILVCASLRIYYVTEPVQALVATRYGWL